MQHLGVNDDSSSTSESSSDIEVSEVEIPPVTYVAPLSPPTKLERQLTCSQLHLEIEKLAEVLTMDKSEIDRKQKLIDKLSDVSLSKSHYEIVGLRPLVGICLGRTTVSVRFCHLVDLRMDLGRSDRMSTLL